MRSIPLPFLSLSLFFFSGLISDAQRYGSGGYGHGSGGYGYGSQGIYNLFPQTHQIHPKLQQPTALEAETVFMVTETHVRGRHLLVMDTEEDSSRVGVEAMEEVGEGRDNNSNGAKTGGDKNPEAQDQGVRVIGSDQPERTL